MDEEMEVETFDDVVDLFMKTEAELLDDEDEEQDVEQEEDADESTEEGDESAEEAEDDASEEDSEKTDGEADKPADLDDTEVDIKVGETDHKVKIKDLKRLFGQEAALTQKSQSVSNQARAVETHGLYLAKILGDRLDAAKEKAAKYEKVDLFKAHRELEPEEFDALRSAKEAAEAEVKTLESEANEFVARAQYTRNAIIREKAKESLKEITKAIPDWNDQLYSDIRTYAISQGMDRDTVNEVVDAGAIIMMHKAMQYDKVQQKKETVVKKVLKAPTKAIKKASNTAEPAQAKLIAKRKAAMGSGSIDDVADLFLAATKN